MEGKRKDAYGRMGWPFPIILASQTEFSHAHALAGLVHETTHADIGACATIATPESDSLTETHSCPLELGGPDLVVH